MTAGAVEVGTGYLSIVPDTSRINPGIRNALGDSQGEARRAGASMGNLLGAGIKTGVAAAGVAAIAALAVGIRGAIEKETSTAKLTASLGLNPQESKELGAVAGRLYANGYGESLSGITESVGDVTSALRGLGVSGAADIERITGKAADFGATFGLETKESIQTVSQLITNGLVPNADKGFDILAKSFQQVPAAMRSELPEIINEYGSNFKNLGFTGEQAFSLLAGAAQKGKFVLDKTGDALKEFTLRGTDMSKASVEAYTKIGLKAEEMSNAIAGGGPAAQDALRKTAAGLLGIKEPAERANTAIALFGTPVEDLAIDQIPAFLQNLAEVPNKLGAVDGAMASIGATMNGTTAASFETIKRRIETGLTNAMGGAVAAMNAAAPSIIAGLDSIGAGAKSLISSDLVTGFGAGLISLGQAVAPSLRGLGAALVDLGNAAAPLVTGSGGALKPTLEGAGAAALWVGQTALPPLIDGLGSVVRGGAAVLGWARDNADYLKAFGVAAAVFAIPPLTALTIKWGSYITLLGISKGAMLATTIATKAAAAGQWLLNVAMSANPIGLIVTGIAALAAGLIYFFTQTETGKRIWDVVWGGIKTGFEATWNFVKPIFGLWLDYLGLYVTAGQKVGEGAMWLWNNALKPAYEGILQLFSWWWGGIKAYWGFWGDAISLAGTKIGEFKDWSVGKLTELVDFVTGLPGRIRAGAAGLWDGLKEGLKGALNWIIQKWNSFAGGFHFTIPDWVPGLGGKTWSLPTIPELATGGEVRGPGTGTSDSILAWLSNGEGVVTAAAMANGGSDLVAALNAGWVPPLEMLRAMLPAFAAGGVASQRGLDYGRSRAGKPYRYGTEDDCSGLWSGIYNAVTGKNVRFNTASDFASFGFKPGIEPGGFNIGTNGGVGTGGHMGGDLLGTPMESNGSAGVLFGAGAAAAKSFPQPWHLPRELWAPPELDNTAQESGAGAVKPAAPGGGASPAAPANPATAPAAAANPNAQRFTAAGNAFVNGQLAATPFGAVAEKAQAVYNIYVQHEGDIVRRLREEESRRALVPGSRF